MSRSPSKGGSGTVTLTVRIQPRASKNGIVRMEDGSLKIRLTAPPVDGAANEALVRFLAERLDVPRSAVRIEVGATGRSKVVAVEGISLEAANRRLEL